MTSCFINRIRNRGGDDRLELTTYAGSLKDAKYIRDSYRAAGLEATIMVRNTEIAPYREESSCRYRS